MKPNLPSKFAYFIMAFSFLGMSSLQGQVLNAPTAAPNQSPPPGITPWNKACASVSFNDYWVEFTWSPPLVNSSNEFILELSDASGSFAAAVELARDGTKNTTFDFFFQFALPPDTRGEGYKMRVRSTNPAKTSAASVAYPMYYRDYDEAILISPNGDGNIPPGGTLELCDGNSVTLAPHNIPNSSSYQYNWYKSSSLIVGEKSNSLLVSTAGMYQVEIDYGACSTAGGGTLSNAIDITTGASLGIAINPPVKTSLCSGETQPLNANITGQGLTYTWYRDNTAITAPAIDADTYIVDASVPGFEGAYQVEIEGPGTCLERSAAITITNAGNFTVSRDNPANVVVLPGQPQTLSVTTDASSPAFQWYKEGVPVAGETGSSILVNDSQAGTYFARVSLSGGPCSSTAIDSENTVVVIPDSFEITIAYATAYTSCQNTSIVLEIGSITAVDTAGGQTDVTADLKSDFSYQWKKDGNVIAGATAETLSLTTINENGDYTVDAALSTYNSTSDSLSVQLLVNETLTLNATSLISCGPSEDITLSTDTSLTGESYNWFRDGVNLNVVSEALVVIQPGTYQLVLDRNGCPLGSNEVVIAPLDEELITVDPGTEIIFPEGGSRTVSASGGESYRWYDANNVEMSASSSVTFTEEGNYILIATIGNCEISRELTVSYLDTFKVPNVITVNGDGINDLWILPNSYSKKEDINVVIYTDNGVEVFNANDYQNNWPQSTTSFPKQNMVFFYKIKKAAEVLKQGTITVIR